MNNSRDKVYIRRDLEAQILGFLNNPEIIAVVGPRQSGKTTLLKHIAAGLKNLNFISFDDSKTLNLFDTDIDGFISRHVEGFDYLFIDEFQYSSRGGKHLKYIFDTKNIKIFITGSSAVGLTVKGLKYLTGRVIVFKLFPLSFREYLEYKDSRLYNAVNKNPLSKPVTELILPHFSEFILFGGYPAVVLEPVTEKKRVLLDNIVSIFILREISELLGIREKDRVLKLCKALSLQIGGLVKYSELSDITGFDFNNLKGNLNVLKETFVCHEVKPFFTNKTSELVKNPKIYFIDSGFRNSLISNFSKERSDLGAIYENFVCSELVKYGFNPNYWRSKGKAEVDFVVDKIPIEIKSTLKSPRLTKSFISFLQSYSPKKGFVLSESFLGKRNLDGTKIIYSPIFSIFKEEIK